MQQQDAPLGAVALGGRLEDVDQLHQRPVEAEDGVAVLVGELGEELVAGDLLLVARTTSSVPCDRIMS